MRRRSREAPRGSYEVFLAGLLCRPVAVTAASLLVLGLGVVALWRLPVALLPAIDYPSLVVWTSYPDAPSSRVEQTVTRPLEASLAGLSGLTAIESTSQLGGSSIRLRFGWNTDLDLTALECRQQIDRALRRLPQGASRPLVLPIDPSAAPLMVLALGVVDERDQDLGHLDQLARNVVSRRLEQLLGVARVRVVGTQTRQIEIALDGDRLLAYGLDSERIAEALRAANVVEVGGTLTQGLFRHAVEIGHQLIDRETVAETIVSAAGQPSIRLDQVAKIRDTMARRRGLARWNGQPAVLLLVERRPDANAVETAKQVHRALGALGEDLSGVRLQTVIDDSESIRAAIDGVAQAVLGGGLLALLTLMLFLRRPRSLLAVASAVGLSLAATLALFDLFGITLNLISLSGLALGVGMLVDNAIVVVEAIARHSETGVAVRVAARRGAAEVASAIGASSLTTMAVFLPLTLVEGLAGRLFRDQSLAVCCSLTASLVAALTVVPLICSRERSSVRKASFDGRLVRAYEAALAACLRNPVWVLAGSLLVLGGCLVLALRLPREALPKTAHGRFDVRLQLPTDAQLELTSTRSQTIERQLLTWPEVEDVLAMIGEQDESWADPVTRPIYRGDLVVKLRPGTEPDRIAERLQKLDPPADTTMRIEPARTRLEALLVSGSRDLMIDLSSADTAKAQRAVAPVLAQLARRPELTDPEALEPEHLFAYRVDLDRAAMARFGVDPASVGAALQVVAGGLEVTRLARHDDDIALNLIAPAFSSRDRVTELHIPTAVGPVTLGSIARLESARVPAVIEKRNQTPVVRLAADLAPRVDLEQGLAAIRAAVSAVDMPGVQVSVHGAHEAFRSSLHALMRSLLFSSILVYLILSVQFESLVQPLVILSAVPLAFAGVVPALAWAGQSWNLMSLTGCVVLVGIAVNDAIVKIDLVNQRRQQGLSLEPAILVAGRERLRPILMTSLTTGLGLLPLALGLGEAGELRAPMAITIIGGLVGSTVLTLTVVPTLYRILAGRAVPLVFESDGPGATRRNALIQRGG